MSATALESSRRAFRSRLLDERVLIDAGAPGLYGRGSAFVRVYDAVDRAIVRNSDHLQSEVVRFPPVEAVAAMQAAEGAAPGERSDDDAEIPGLDVVLTRSACDPLFATLDTVPADGRVFDVLGDVFRAEPSDDPMQMRTFHRHVFVHVGSAEGAVNHRDTNIPLVADMLRSFGLEIAVVTAESRYDFVTPVYGLDQQPIAIASGTLHEDRLCRAFDIRTDDGEVASSSCFGFDLERITLALVNAHGSDVDAWPAPVREVLRL